MLKAPHWYDSPEKVSIMVDKGRVKRSHLGNEVVVFCDINGDEKSAVIPTFAFNEHDSTVVAAKVGSVDNYVLLSFPPGSSGTNTWAVPIDLLNNIIVSK